MAKVLAFMAGMLAAAIPGCSPFGGGAFTCAEDTQCNAKAGGRCESNGFCSYADASCPSGQIYGEHSGDNSGECVGGGPNDDGGVGVCYGVGLVKPCFATAPTGNVTLTDPVDTDMAGTCATVLRGGDGLCVVAANEIQVEELVRVTGSKPLVLVGVSLIAISGTLDAASHHSNNPPNAITTVQIGAGAAPAGACGTPTAPAASSGGAGGTLIARGGQGGNTGGTSGEMQTVTALRGGCRGQNGATGTPGDGGHGGGALYLISNTSIAISGGVNASGEGGHPGVTGDAGGGGGGSGGMIGLDSPAIMNTGNVFANGGSGGEGSGNATQGSPGPEANSASATPNSPSFSNGGFGGSGGAGGSAGGPSAGGVGENAVGFGGGGGGGGTGLIKVYRGTLPGSFSPMPTMP